MGSRKLRDPLTDGSFGFRQACPQSSAVSAQGLLLCAGLALAAVDGAPSLVAHVLPICQGGLHGACGFPGLANPNPNKLFT